MISKEQLIAEAREARKNAYAPYSKYQVGAAVLGEDGNIYRGGNIENCSYGATVCAERTAIFGMVNAGCRTFTAIAVVCGENEDSAPCMICRQVLTEFCKDLDIPVYFGALDGTIYDHTLRELAPLPFMAFEANRDYHG